MTQLKLEVGKKYILGDINSSIYTYLGNVDDNYFFGNDKTCTFHKFKESKLREFGYKEHIEEPMKKEINLEVGKKYNIKDCAMLSRLRFTNPCLFVFEDKEGFLFIDANKTTFWFYKTWNIEGITEHREMFKNSIEVWINVVEEEGDPDNPLNRLLGGRDVFYPFLSKKDALRFRRKSIIYGRLTFEQLPEPEET